MSGGENSAGHHPSARTPLGVVHGHPSAPLFGAIHRHAESVVLANVSLLGPQSPRKSAFRIALTTEDSIEKCPPMRNKYNHWTYKVATPVAPGIERNRESG